MDFKFERLTIWQKSMDFGESIDTMAYKIPKDEIFNLSSQIRRAVDSMALNISEGSIGQTNLDKINIYLQLSSDFGLSQKHSQCKIYPNHD